MGVTYEQVKSGMLDLGNIISQGMAAYERVTGKVPVPTTVATPQPAAPATTETQASTQAPTGALSFGGLPGWAIVAGGLALLWYFSRR